eukprot:CAMPEP_0184479134 /NCGR_PEP_ID=MMETSP0113_2-20130426/972_1 /TAXON_ID=91329 /ORGANISM="Norrisiella sphaerica, Strain BC52" /LENGTH=145 /DNA_ID=CAMNT_0026857143 /DNA_START=124 /DNA_END=561 /DNA_ORIENTATION=-
MTTIYTIYVYNREGTCLFLRKYNGDSKQNPKEIEIEKKNMFGTLFTLKTFVNAITPKTMDEWEKEPISYFQTSQYQLHYLETASGLRFAVSTPPDAPNMGRVLNRLYKLYVDYVVRNPCYTLGSEIVLPGFVQRVETYVKELRNK